MHIMHALAWATMYLHSNIHDIAYYRAKFMVIIAKPDQLKQIDVILG